MRGLQRARALVVILVLGCDQGRSRVSPDLVFQDSDPAPAREGRRAHPPLHEWSVVGEWGSLSGPLAFSIINGVALRPDSLLAVADRNHCRVTFIDIPSDSVWHVGRCGQGPDEFQNIGSVTFSGSHLWAFDLVRRRFVEIDSVAQAVRRAVPLADYFDAGEIADIAGLAPAGRDRLTVALRRRVPRTSGLRSMVATLDFASRDFELHPVYDAPASRDTDFAWAPSVEICGDPSGDWRAANEWTSQLVAFGADTAPHFNVLVEPREWWTPPLMQGPTLSPIPPQPRPRLACVDGLTFVGYKRRNRIEGRSTILHSRLVVVDAGGRVIHDEEVEGPIDGSAHAFTVGSASGALLITYTSTFAAYPTVRAHRIPDGILGR